MSSNHRFPDYELEDLRVVSSRQELRAMSEPVRSTIMQLLLERAATVGELAAALGRPKSTVAYHVGVLLDAGILKVVRTRRVRAIDERFYGRTARIFYAGVLQPGDQHIMANHLSVAAAESAPAHDADRLRAILRYTRISDDSAASFWERVFALVDEFNQLPRSGDTVHGFVAGLYPTEQHPTLPERSDDGPTGR
jgi:DNA-binding transcriptional ArsR family regulator